MSGPGTSPRKARSRLSDPQTHCTPYHARCPHTCSVWRRPTILSTQSPKRPAKSELNPCTDGRRWTALRPNPVPFARKRGMSPSTPRFPPLLLVDRTLAFSGFRLVVRAVHGARLGRELGELHLVVAEDQDLECFAHGGGAIELLDGHLGALRRGHVGAATDVVMRHGDFVVRESIAQVDHAAARIVRV